MSQIVIRKATIKDLPAIKGLADMYRHELGFVLQPALARSIERGEIFVAENGTRTLGFVEYHHRRDGQTTLYHIAVHPDYRNQGIGRKLMECVHIEAQSRGQRCVRLKCPTDLSANHFYSKIGFQCEDELPSKRRHLRVWVSTIG